MPSKLLKNDQDVIKKANSARENKLREEMYARFRANPEHYQHDMSQYASKSKSIKWACEDVDPKSGLLASPVSTRKLDFELNSDLCFSDGGEDKEEESPKEQNMRKGKLRAVTRNVNAAGSGSGSGSGGNGAALAQANNELRSSAGNNPEASIREEVFDQLAWCGYLDQSQPHLIRWAVGIYWDIQMSKQRSCSAQHEVEPPIPLEGGGDCNYPAPPVLYRLFVHNAILPHHVRQSATTRALIILYALYYLANVPCCAICGASKDGSEMIDLRSEMTNPAAVRSFDEWEPAVVARMTVDWAAAIRCAVAYLVDAPRDGYWRRYTCHIPTETGEAVTRCLQHNLSYQINVPHDRLMTWMDKLTDFHPFAIAPKSDRVYRPPKNPKGDNLADLINGLMLAGAQ